MKIAKARIAATGIFAAVSRTSLTEISRRHSDAPWVCVSIALTCAAILAHVAVLS